MCRQLPSQRRSQETTRPDDSHSSFDICRLLSIHAKRTMPPDPTRRNPQALNENTRRFPILTFPFPLRPVRVSDPPLTGGKPKLETLAISSPFTSLLTLRSI